jgi:hypothetical protein
LAQIGTVFAIANAMPTQTHSLARSLKGTVVAKRNRRTKVRGVFDQ